MARFKVLVGQHVAADRSKPLHGPDARPIPGRFESRTYAKGETVESDADLVAKFGPEKFAYADRGAENERIAELEAEIAKLKSQQAKVVPTARGPVLMTPGEPTAQQGPSVAPGGQVSTGVQGDVDAANAQLKAQGGQGELYAEPVEDDDALENLTVEELRDLAADEEIPLHGASRKAEIIEAVRRGRRG